MISSGFGDYCRKGLVLCLSTAWACSMGLGPVSAAEEGRWVSLFDGQSLEGWVQHNGTATYRVEEDTIVGRTSEGSPNSFLCTKTEFADFDLTFEVLVDDELNSGVQFRSRSKPEFNNGRVHGPQVEIAASGSSGFVYGEALDTGWLHTEQPDTPAVQSAFRRGEWNKYRVLAVGSSIKTWVNDVPIIDFTDTRSKMNSGFIGLQVHGIARGSGPYEVRWRNLRIRDLTVRKVVFIGAGGGHGGEAHQHISGNRLLAKALRESGFRFETTEFDGWPTDANAFDDVDAVVIYCNGGSGHLVMPHLDQFDALMRKGVGLACLHYAVEVPEGKPGDLMLEWIGGYFETHWSVNPWWTADFTALPAHPVANGVQPFRLQDEWYYHMRFAKDMIGVTPILSAHPPMETLNRPDGPHENNPSVRGAIRRGEIQHLAWAYERPEEKGGGRGFGSTGGHPHKIWADDNYRRTIVNAIAWVAGVWLPAEGIDSQVEL